MNITVYTSFSKRKNSTKQPTGGTSVTCDIKHTNSMRQPTFHINKDDLTGGVVPENIKYVKDTDHGIYYFVDDIEYVPNKFYALHCTIDPMATYKSAITGSTQYVCYSASCNRPYVPDPRIPKQPEILTNIFVPSEGNPYVSAPSGYYLVTCLSSDGSGIGGRFLTTYMCDEYNVTALAQKFTDNTFKNSMFLSATDAFSCVTSVMYMPINASPVHSTTKERIYLGDLDMGLNADGFIVSGYNNNAKFEQTFTPSWRYFDDWRISPPYTTAILYIPGYGTVDINPLHCDSNLQVTTYVDTFTGDTTSFIKGKNQADSDYNLIATLNYNIGIQIPMAQYTSNAMGTLSSLLSAGGSLLSAAVNPIGGAYGFASSIGNAAINANSMTASVKGSTSGTSWFDEYQQCKLIERCVNTFNVDSMNVTKGMPLMEETTLSTLSGYCQCENASVSINGFDADRDIINGYLNSGFYIE